VDPTGGPHLSVAERERGRKGGSEPLGDDWVGRGSRPLGESWAGKETGLRG
jgi:hypothetical protein